MHKIKTIIILWFKAIVYIAVAVVAVYIVGMDWTAIIPEILNDKQ